MNKFTTPHNHAMPSKLHVALGVAIVVALAIAIAGVAMANSAQDKISHLQTQVDKLIGLAAHVGAIEASGTLNLHDVKVDSITFEDSGFKLGTVAGKTPTLKLSNSEHPTSTNSKGQVVVGSIFEVPSLTVAGETHLNNLEATNGVSFPTSLVYLYGIRPPSGSKSVLVDGNLSVTGTVTPNAPT